MRGLLGGDDSSNPNPAAARPPAATLDISNASGRDGLAGTLGKVLSTRGLTAGAATTDRKIRSRTTLFYAPDTQQAARLLGEVSSQPDHNLDPGHLRLVLGTDFTLPTDFAGSPGTSDDAASVQGARSSDPGGVPASSLHTDGIPCVK